MNFPDGQLPCEYTLEWRGCYSGQYDLWTPESYSHPAKMAPGLAFRILAHLEELGLIKPGDAILDPMCGIGTSLLTACVKGYSSVGVELEEKFVKLAQANANRLAAKGFTAPIAIIQGDARQLLKLLQEFGSEEEGSLPSARGGWDRRMAGNSQAPVVALTSPPYSEAQSGGGIAQKGYQRDKHSPIKLVGQRTYMPENIGSTPGQIGALPDKPLKAVMSPPYGNIEARNRSEEPSWKAEAEHLRGDRNISQGIGSSSGNIGNLPDRPLKAITSPPYEDSEICIAGQSDIKERKERRASGTWEGYGNAQAQIGQECGGTYLEAMLQVYAEIAKVADVLVVVTKNPTRAGKLRRLDLDTIALLEATGWHIHCQHKAMLFEEQEQGHLFEGSKKRTRGRLSFFKRLNWQKGSPVAQWEDIIIAEKRLEAVSLSLF